MVAAGGFTERTCATGLPLAAGPDGATVYRVDTLRAAYAGTTYVYVARDPATGAARVIGIWRP